MEIHQLISKLQTPSKEEIRYKVGEVLGKSATSEVEQALRQRDEGAEGVYSQIIRRYFIGAQSINDSQEYTG